MGGSGPIHILQNHFRINVQGSISRALLGCFAGVIWFFRSSDWFSLVLLVFPYVFGVEL